MKLHFGKPKPGVMKFRTGASGSRTYHREHFVEHTIQWWLGLSYSNKWFAGFIKMEGSRHFYDEKPIEGAALTTGKSD